MKELKFAKVNTTVVDEKGKKVNVTVPEFVLAIPATVEELKALSKESLELVFASLEEVIKSKAGKRALFMVENDEDLANINLDSALSMTFSKNTKNAQLLAVQAELQNISMAKDLIFAKFIAGTATPEDMASATSLETEKAALSARATKLEEEIEESRTSKNISRTRNARIKELKEKEAIDLTSAEVKELAKLENEQN